MVQSVNLSAIFVHAENMSSYSYCGEEEHHVLHMVRLKKLPVGSTVYYMAEEFNVTSGSALQSSPIHQFEVFGPSESTKLRFFAIADMGNPKDHPWMSIPQMRNTCKKPENPHDPLDNLDVSLGVHVGDISYNLDIPGRGDDYVAGMSIGMGSNFPWMMAPGNHEADCNYTYTNYKGRFAAQNFTSSSSNSKSINSNSSRWYSFDKVIE